MAVTTWIVTKTTDSERDRPVQLDGQEPRPARRLPAGDRGEAQADDGRRQQQGDDPCSRVLNHRIWSNIKRVLATAVTGSGQPPTRTTRPSVSTIRAARPSASSRVQASLAQDDGLCRRGVRRDAGVGDDRDGPPRPLDRGTRPRVDEVMPVGAVDSSPATHRRARGRQRTRSDRDDLARGVGRGLAVLAGEDPPTAVRGSARGRDVPTQTDQDPAVGRRITRSRGGKVGCQSLAARAEVELDPGRDSDRSCPGVEADDLPARDRPELDVDGGLAPGDAAEVIVVADDPHRPADRRVDQLHRWHERPRSRS